MLLGRLLPGRRPALGAAVLLAGLMGGAAAAPGPAAAPPSATMATGPMAAPPQADLPYRGDSVLGDHKRALGPEPGDDAPAAKPRPAPRSWAYPSGRLARTPKRLAELHWYPCALSFDDGPSPKDDPKLIAILEKARVPATFFYVGEQAEAHPDIVREVVKAGFGIGDHSWTHPDLAKLPADAEREQLARTRAFLETLGAKPLFFRPPYGALGGDTVGIAKSVGLETVRWTVDSLDWKARNKAKILENVLSETRPGALVLMHSTVPETVEALPEVIEAMRQKGCSFVSVGTWAAIIDGEAPVPAAAPAAAAVPANR